MHVEFDHIFICTDPGAELAARRLRDLGLTEGPSNTHPGQGTACRRFFFRNAYIELLWVSDEREARSPLVAPTQLWERWSGRRGGACPFGIALRPVTGVLAGDGPRGSLPFESWEYRPPYLPPGMAIHMASQSHTLAEPMLFYLPLGLRPDALPADRHQPMEHAWGAREITRVSVRGPWEVPASTELAAMVTLGVLQTRSSCSFELHLGIDCERRGERSDCGPELPLVLLR